MLIHRVRPGDTLRDIAALYGTSTRDIIHYNELESDTLIVPGQHLLVPGPATLAKLHKVAAGDTIASLARRYGVDRAELAGWLGLKDDSSLQTGELLYVPQRVNSRRTIETNGYLIPSGNVNDARLVQDVGQRLTYICIFSYQARADGTLVPENDREAISAAKQVRVAPLMTVTNFDGNNFNTELAHSIMSNPSIKRKLIQNIVSSAQSKGYRGVNVDFEHMRPTDRPLYNEFVRELGAACRNQGLSISIAMGPKTSDEPTASWMGAFDYRTLGEEVDFIMLMTYEWGWVGGPLVTTNELSSCR